VSAIAERKSVMSKPGDVAIDVPDDSIEEALSDHHLDEVAEMIERSHAENPPLESPFSDPRAGSISVS
jgi:hypothetical protein